MVKNFNNIAFINEQNLIQITFLIIISNIFFNMFSHCTLFETFNECKYRAASIENIQEGLNQEDQIKYV